MVSVFHLTTTCRCDKKKYHPRLPDGRRIFKGRIGPAGHLLLCQGQALGRTWFRHPQRMASPLNRGKADRSPNSAESPLDGRRALLSVGDGTGLDTGAEKATMTPIGGVDMPACKNVPSLISGSAAV